MLIGIISDTHDNVPKLLEAVKIFNRKRVGLVLHLGDWAAPFTAEFVKELKCKVISLFGNNTGDIFLALQWQKEKHRNIEYAQTVYEMNADGRKIIAYHGDARPLTDALINCQKYDAVFTGHTHIALNETVGKTLHINPGSLAYGQGGKINQKHSVAIYDSKTNQAEVISL